MENIRGKQHIGDEQFGPGSYDEAMFQELPKHSENAARESSSASGLTRAASASAISSPSRHVKAIGPQEETVAPIVGAVNFDEVATTTPLETPHPGQTVDGPISASKSKLQSIMKTARGLFTSSAGVSAQAKIEALSSPSARTRTRLAEIDVNRQSVSGRDSPDFQQYTESTSPKKEPEGRKTRSSTEKEEKRKQEEAAVRSKADAETRTAQIARTEIIEDEQIQAKAIQPSQPARQSPRRLQKPTESKPNPERSDLHSDIASSAAPALGMGPPQAQPPQSQKPKDSRRPIKPAKETNLKPAPQKIRVGAPSQQPRPVLSNAALSSSLQDSLPATQTRPPGIVKKPSNASIQTSTSSNSLKSSVSSVSTKPKALLAAERKKEQVSRSSDSWQRVINNYNAG